MPQNRAEMIAAAKAKYRQEMVAQAKAKWAQDNQPTPAEPSRTAEQVETGARGFLESASLGISEPIISGINAAVQTGVDTALSGDLSELSVKNLKEEYNRDVERRRALKEDLQGSDIAGQVVGAFMPGTIAAKAASVGGKLAKAALPQVVSKVPVLGKAAGATAEAAGMALGQEVPQAVVEQASGHREFSEQPNVLENAKTSGMVGAGMSLAGSAAQGAGKAALGAVSAVAGNVDPATMKKYLDWKRAGGVDRSLPEMKGAVDNAVEFVRQESNGMKADFADSAVQAVDRLKQRVTQGSAEAYDILERTPGVIPSDALMQSVEQAKRTALGPAKVAIGPTTKAAIAQLDALATDVSQLPKQIDLVTAKSILQRLDDSISYSNRAGEFGGVGSNAFKSIRQNLDAIVKTMSPEYAAKMEDVAQAARSLDNIKTQFGTVEQAQRQIPSLLAGKDAAKANALQYLDKTTGMGLGSMVSEIQKREIINVMRPGQTEGFIKRIIGGRSIENRQMLAQLATLSEQDLVKMADDAAMTSLFDREFRAGSQHVNFWTVLGGVGMGAAVDDSGLGMGGGAVLGVLTTKYGPRATKMLLDQVARMNGTPTFQKIERMEIPEALRRELKMGLLRSINTWKDYTPVRIPKEQVVFIQGDIRSSDALTPMQKAKAMDQLARDEGIDPEVMKALMVSEGRAEPRMQVKGNLPDDQGGRSESVQR